MANHLCGARKSMAPSWYSRVPTIRHHHSIATRFSSSVRTTTLTLKPSKVFSIASCSLTMAARTMGSVSTVTMTILVVVVVVVALASCRAAAQGNGCSSVVMTLNPCMDFISSKASEPGVSCCSVLAGVVHSDPRCLCMILDGTAASFGIAVNQTRAMELPGVCKVKAPPISQCAAPAPAPSNESAAAKEEEEPESTSDAPSGNETSSSTNSKNAASLMATMLIPICALLYAL